MSTSMNPNKDLNLTQLMHVFNHKIIIYILYWAIIESASIYLVKTGFVIVAVTEFNMA